MSIKQQREDIAVSLFLMPCTEEELCKREFLKTTSFYGVGRMLQQLENQGAIYYKGEVMHIKKEWAKKNLQGRELDFRSERQKKIDSLSAFQRHLYDQGLLDI